MEEMKTTNEFRNFDVVSDVSDHYFDRSSSGKTITDNPDSEAYKRIMMEWETLEQTLPESIYVRVYNNRIDLMRAAIVGAAGTPYHDGLFFFDIAYPSDYPHNPPNFHFISFRLKLHPNLSVNGEVSMSLLNTGETSENGERWDPSVSTVLQVLVSLRELVLNEKPYFNEPGKAMFRIVDDDSSRAYNEQVYLLTCRFIPHLLLSPPTNFKTFVLGYFRKHAPAILSALREYANGRVSVGYYGREPSPPVKVSPEFMEQARGFYPGLCNLFILCDPSLDASFYRLELPSESKSRIKKRGLLKKLIKVIKSVA